MIRVLVVDDQEMSRSGAIGMLRGFADIEVVGEADSGPAAIEAVARLTPDVVLMDVRMPGGDGIDAAREIISGPHPAEVIMLTTFDLHEYMIDAFTAGVAGFLLKDASALELADAVRAAMRGDAAISPRLARRVMAGYGPHESDEVAAAADDRTAADGITVAGVKFSAREVRILRAVVAGRTNRQIAAELAIAPSTVKTHVSRMLAKAGLENRTQLGTWGMRNQLSR